MQQQSHAQSYSPLPSSTPRDSAAHSTSSAFSTSANPKEDYTKILDAAERRKVSNRITQRNYRKKLKERLEDLERRAASASTSPEQSHAKLDYPSPGSSDGGDSANQQHAQPPPSSFSMSLSGPKPKSTTSRPSHTKPLTSSRTPIPRPFHTSLHDSDDDQHDDPHHHNNSRSELVSAFDSSAGGAISVFGAKDGEGRKKELVIAVQKNRDWREESRRKKGRGRDLLSAEARVAREAKQDGAQEVINGDVQAYGLSFVKTTVAADGKGVEHGDGDVQMEGAARVQVVAVEEPAEQKTEDELALEALLDEGGSKKSTMVLPAVVEARKDDEDGIWDGRAGTGISEDDAFRSDVASRPDSASLEDYAAVPVEEFGAALLRGMGWKEGEVVGKRKDQVSKPRILERRPALLGIGAKEVPGGVGDEIGAWGRAAKGRRKVEKSYNPVLLRNSKTGEMVTEEELKAKKEEQKREEEEDWRMRRNRNLMVDREKKSARSPERYRQVLSTGIEIVTENVSHSGSAINDGLTRTEITKVADRVLHGGPEVNHRKGGIDAMMTTTLEIRSTGDAVEMTIPTIPARPGTVAGIENVMIIRAEGAGKKCTEPFCRALVVREDCGERSGDVYPSP